MDFSLSSSLVGNAVSNPDKLALDLQFATDKTLTARKGPTPVFTRASTGRFVGSNGLIQSAAINAPRFDHDPVTGVCKGLLIEEQRTNVCLQSENFGTTWIPSNSTFVLNVATSPDGTTTADKIINGNGLTLGRIQQQLTINGSHVYSVFAKVDGWNWVYIAPLQATGGVWFNLANGTVGTQQAGFVGSITSFGNGWYRCAVQCTGTGVSLTARIHPTNADNVLTVGDGTNGIFLWGAQMEAGAFATSYILTGASSVLRSADVCSITGSAFSGFYNQTDSTIVSAGLALGFTSNNNMFYSIESGTTGIIRIFNRSAQSNRLTTSISGTTLTPATNYNTAGVIYKSAVSANADGADFVIDGTQIPDVFTGSSLTADNLKFSGIAASTSNNIISSFRYYKKRLPVSKLQALTV